jgi:mannan endo-1,4-beta-mannosidase
MTETPDVETRSAGMNATPAAATRGRWRDRRLLLRLVGIVLIPTVLVIALVGGRGSAPATEGRTPAGSHTGSPGVDPASRGSTKNLGVTAPNHRIYWGAYIDGTDTYRHLYGGGWGDAPWDASTWTKFEAAAGKKVAIVHWAMNWPPWQRDFDYWLPTFDLVRRAGAINAVEMGTRHVPLRDIANGRYDGPLATWMRQAAAWQHPFFLILDSEMNGTWKPYSIGRNGNTARDFVRMWRRVHDIARREGATNITWVWTVNIDPTNQFTPYEQLYPGESYVDWTGLNGFNGEGDASFSWLFSTSYASLLQVAPTKPIVITETGSVEGGIGKAAWIRDAFSDQLPQNFPQIRAVLWFNWRIRSGGRWRDYEIESSRSAQLAFEGAIASPYYAGRGMYDSPPLLGKIEPLR